MLLFEKARQIGFSGVGLSQRGDHAKRFVNLDTKPRKTLWSYWKNIIPNLDSNYFYDPILRSKILYSLMKVHKSIYIEEHIYMYSQIDLTPSSSQYVFQNLMDIRKG